MRQLRQVLSNTNIKLDRYDKEDKYVLTHHDASPLAEVELPLLLDPSKALARQGESANAGPGQHSLVSRNRTYVNV